MTSPDRISELAQMAKEFDEETTSEERRVELVTALRDFAEEELPDSRCVHCHRGGFSVPYTHALIEGHCYSPAGVADYTRITKVCEFCFDKTHEKYSEFE